jgi:hypothetical protein
MEGNSLQINFKIIAEKNNWIRRKMGCKINQAKNIGLK